MNRRRKMTIALIVLAAVIAVLGAILLFTSVSAANGAGLRWGFDRDHMDGFRGLAYGGRYMGYGHFGFLWLPIVGLVVLFAVLARAGRRYHHFHGYGHSFRRDEYREAGESAIEVLRREFAEGRISMEDFVARKKVLDEDEGAGGKEASK